MTAWRFLTIANVAPHSSITAMARLIDRALREAGADSRLVTYLEDAARRDERSDRFLDLLQEMADTGPTVYVDINAKDRLPEAISAAGVRRLCLMTDPAVLHLDRLCATRPDDLIAYQNGADLAVLAACGLADRAFFLPIGGPPAPAALSDDGRRDTAIFFFGALTHPHRPAEVRTILEPQNPALAAVTAAAFERCCDEAGADAFAAVRAAALAAGVELPVAVAGRAAAAIANWCEAAARHRGLTALSGLPVTVVGPVRTDFFDRAPDGFTFLPPERFETCLARLRQTRLMLNTGAKFADGVHERVWYGIAAGAAVVTGPSRFLQRDFRDGRDLLFWDGTQGAGPVADLLADAARRSAMARTALDIYRGRHTWRARIDTIFARLQKEEPCPIS